MKPKAYSYVRISSKGQEKGTGVSRQIQAAIDYANTYDLDLDTNLEDIGKSGFHGHHVKFGALGGFLDIVKKGEIPIGSYLLVESLDRLSREDVLIAQARFIELLSAGIYVVTLIDKMVYHKDKDFTQLIISLTYMSRANNESAEKSKRIKDVINRRKAEAIEGKPRYNRSLPMWLTQTRQSGIDYTFELNDNANSIRKIFELADSGIGIFAIVRELNSNGYPVLNPSRNKRGQWRESTVGAILRNEVVIGTYTPNGTPIPNYYPAAISPDVYWRVQNRRAKFNGGRKGNEFSNLFPHLGRCVQCGGNLRMTNGGATGYAKIKYYSCLNRVLSKNHQCSGSHYLQYKPLENSILDHVSEFFQVFDELNISGKNKLSLNRELEEKKSEYTRLESERTNLVKMVMLLNDPADQLDLANRINGHREKIESIKSRINSIEMELAKTDVKSAEFKSAVEIISTERAMWENKTSEASEIYQSRARIANILRELISAIDIDFINLEATVWIGAFTTAYKFDKTGKLIGQINLIPMLQPVTSYEERTETGRIKEIRKFNGSSTPALTDEHMINFMKTMGWKEDRIETALKATKKILAAS